MVMGSARFRFSDVIPSDSEGSRPRQAYEPRDDIGTAFVARRVRDPSSLRSSG